MLRHHSVNINQIQRAIIEVAEQSGAEKAILFGSFARGDFSKKSDIDVIFITQSKESFIDRIGSYIGYLRDKDALKPFDIDVLVYTPEEFLQMKKKGNRFISRAVKEGVVLYERGKGQEYSGNMV